MYQARYYKPKQTEPYKSVDFENYNEGDRTQWQELKDLATDSTYKIEIYNVSDDFNVLRVVLARSGCSGRFYTHYC